MCWSRKKNVASAHTRQRAVSSIIQVMPMTEACPDMGRCLRNVGDGDKEVWDMEGEAAASDLYGMFGYRARPIPAITTQQWLAFRLIEL